MDLANLLKEQEDRLRRIEAMIAINKNILNIDEVCLFTGLSKSHLYKLTCSGEIPYYKKSKHLFFDRVEIENWIKAKRSLTNDELKAEADKHAIRRIK